MTIIGRRRCLQCAGAAFAAGLSGNVRVGAARSARVYCRYSVAEGWSHSPPARPYTVLRVAGPDDPSGLPQAILRIRQALAFSDAFEIRIAQGQNNASTTMENGRRIITADVGFLLNVNRWAATRWAAIQVLAHEVGHHLARSDEPHRAELEADYWSGRTLRLLGSGREAARASILAIGTDHDTSTHPNKFSRARVIERGWDDSSDGWRFRGR